MLPRKYDVFEREMKMKMEDEEKKWRREVWLCAFLVVLLFDCPTKNAHSKLVELGRVRLRIDKPQSP